MAAFEQLWRTAAREFEGARVEKVGIWMSQLTESALCSPGLFDLTAANSAERGKNISAVMDQITKKFGKDALLLGMPGKVANYTGSKIAFDRIPDRDEFYE